ncbi:hypothetical protein [Sphingomonas pseudosanguinis]|uniref:Sugar phosphate permease n=1 Tax=Sphingomonas pseudosanguinis TaxID=413712 RepID=A0A7W6F250_9SPHN|nr:hypothetical protein [Sphingomonas pseudosanguinis]MBB3878428.1 sugar phosphate permease [Sphingomonas pseudosanguinis]MBN3536315.1 hypothetical protein [Sphingomonas pseudosanguinis]
MDLLNSRMVGAAVGMVGPQAWVGGVSFTLSIGLRAEAWRYDPLFAMLAAFDLDAAAFCRRPEPSSAAHPREAKGSSPPCGYQVRQHLQVLL